MVSTTLQLTDENKRKLDDLSHRTGKTPDELANKAIHDLASSSEAEEQRRFQEWRESMLGIEGMWKDRTDLPDFAELRRSWDRPQIK
jgi:predicted transcriptional regulator